MAHATGDVRPSLESCSSRRSANISKRIIILEMYMTLKSKLVAILGAAAMLVFPAMTFASSNISNIKFDNGQTSFSCTAGQSVNVTFRVVVPAGEVAEIGQTDVISDSLAPSLPFQLGGDLGLQEGPNDVNTSVTCPQNTGYYTVELRTAGIFGGLKAIAITDGVTSLGSFSNALRVVASGSTTGGGSTPSQLDVLLAQIQSLTAQLGCMSTGGTWANNACVPKPAPTASTACTQYAQANAGTQPNVYSDANVRLQGFLLSQGASIPALKAGASFGFYGNQTTAAVGWFNSLNHCS